MSNKVFDVIKWLAIAVLPAIGALYGNLATIWGLPYAVEIPQTCDYVGVFLAVVLGISNYNYYREFPQEAHDEDQDADPSEVE